MLLVMSKGLQSSLRGLIRLGGGGAWRGRGGALFAGKGSLGEVGIEEGLGAVLEECGGLR
jgi:hypothetical protein